MAELIEFLTSVGPVQFDAVLSENHQADSVISDHDVDEGVAFSDHVRANPLALDINGVVTNYPIVVQPGTARSPIKTDLAPTDNRMQAAYAKFLEMRDAGEPVTVVTSLRDYDSMVIQSVGVGREPATGNILNIALSMREIRVATALSAELPDPESTTKKASANKGTATPQQDNQAPPPNLPPNLR